MRHFVAWLSMHRHGSEIFHFVFWKWNCDLWFVRCSGSLLLCWIPTNLRMYMIEIRSDLFICLKFNSGSSMNEVWVEKMCVFVCCFFFYRAMAISVYCVNSWWNVVDVHASHSHQSESSENSNSFLHFMCGTVSLSLCELSPLSRQFVEPPLLLPTFSFSPKL